MVSSGQPSVPLSPRGHHLLQQALQGTGMGDARGAQRQPQPRQQQQPYRRQTFHPPPPGRGMDMGEEEEEGEDLEEEEEDEDGEEEEEEEIEAKHQQQYLPHHQQQQQHPHQPGQYQQQSHQQPPPRPRKSMDYLAEPSDRGARGERGERGGRGGTGDRERGRGAPQAHQGPPEALGDFPEEQIVESLLLRFLPLARRRAESSFLVEEGQQTVTMEDVAYEKALDSMAMVAGHMPLPLFRALLTWRESELPKGQDEHSSGTGGAAGSLQRKLLVETVFVSACTRFVECCAADGLPENLWGALEDFVYDWLIAVERLVPQAEFPGLLYLRLRLLDCVAELLGALSGKRFESVTGRFFAELEARYMDQPSRAHESLSASSGSAASSAGGTGTFPSLTGNSMNAGSAHSVNSAYGSGGSSAASVGSIRQIPVLEVFSRSPADRMPSSASSGGSDYAGRRFDPAVNRTELLNIIHGMRFLRLNMVTASGLLQARNFVVRANPLARVPPKKKTELQHALCTMLTAILSPITETPRGRWPPAVKSGDALAAWHSAALQLRGQLSQWVDPRGTLSLQMDKQSRHVQVAYPLNTLLICLGEQLQFDSLFSPYVDLLYKQMREKSNRAVALDCLHRLVHFYLQVYAQAQPKSRVWEKLELVTKQLLTHLKKGVLATDALHDRLVDLCVTVAAADLEFAVSHMVLELLKTEGLGEAKVVGLRALLAVVDSTLHRTPSSSSSSSSTSTSTASTGASATEGSRRRTGGRDSGSASATGGGGSAGAGDAGVRVSPLGLSPGESPLLAPHMNRVRVALGSIIKQCHMAFGSQLLISPKSTLDTGKEKSPSWQVFKWALRCMPHLIPEQWRNDKMTEIIPVYAISVDPTIREEAVQVLFRTVRDLPQCRFPILRGMANFILKIPDDYPALIHASLLRLVHLLNAWRVCLAQEASASLFTSPTVFGAPGAAGAAGDPLAREEMLAARSRQVLAAHGGDEGLRFDPSGMDAVGLIFLCSADDRIRRTALDLLRNVRALQRDLARLFAQSGAAGGDLGSLAAAAAAAEELPTTYIIDIIEETGEDVVQKCYWDAGRWQEAKPERDISVPPEVTLQSIIEASDRGRWGRCLSELIKYCAELCPSSVQGARLEVVARMTPLSPADLGLGGGRGGERGGGAGVEQEGKLEQWQLYAMFACACPPEDAPDGGVQSVKDLVRIVLPMARLGAEGPMTSVTLALGHAHAGICETVLTELMVWMQDLVSEMDSRKWKNSKIRKEDMRVFMAQVHRLVAENLWPGVLLQRPWLRQLFLHFIDNMASQVSLPNMSPEMFAELQPLRFALASVVRCLSIEMSTCARDRFDPKFRRRLFELLSQWCEEKEGGGLGEGAAMSDFRRDVERAKAAAVARVKEAGDRAAVEREMNEQADAIHGMAMEAMATLLHGPCFDDGVRKMTGRAVTWLRSLLESGASAGAGSGAGAGPGGLMGAGGGMGMGLGMMSAGSPRDAYGRRKASEGPYGGRGWGGAREWRSLLSSPAWRRMLGKEALLNLLKTNPEILPAAIDQCYNPDPGLADGFFTVLAEVYMREESPHLELHRLLSLILYKVVDPSRSIRDDALQMLETLSMRDWSDPTSSYASSAAGGRYRAAVVGSLPDSYQQFQFQLSAKLAHEHPEMSELLCEEIMQRQLDAVNIIAQHQVLTCMAPWIENLNFAALWESGWSERLLKSLYYVTWRHGDQFPDEIEKLWSTVAAKRRNIIPVINFLISKGLEDCDSAGGEISGALETYFSVAKRVSLYLARISPQQTIDHLVFELSQRILDEDTDKGAPIGEDSPSAQGQAAQGVLHFSQGSQVDLELTVPFVAQSRLGAPGLGLAGGPQGGALQRVGSTFAPRTASGHSQSADLSLRSTPSSGAPSAAAQRTSSLRMGRGAGTYDALQGFPLDLGLASGGLMDVPGGRDPPLGTSALGSQASGAGGGGGGGGKGAPAASLLLLVPHTWLTRSDLALILLAEIAYENDEDFRGHLPLLFHATFILMDCSEVIVLEHAQQLLVNLLYTLAGRHLELYDARDQSEGEYKQQVVSLIKYVQSKKGSLMWPCEDMSLTRAMLPSATLLTSLVTSVVDAIFFQSDLRERWGEEALKWLVESASRHAAGRSHQMYRALRPRVTSETSFLLLRSLARCFSNPTPSILGFVLEILLTLQVVVESLEAEKMILYPHVFWGCVALLHTDFVHAFRHALDLLSRIIDKLSFQDRTTENVLLASMPDSTPPAAHGFGDALRDAAQGVGAGSRGEARSLGGSEGILGRSGSGGASSGTGSLSKAMGREGGRKHGGSRGLQLVLEEEEPPAVCLQFGAVEKLILKGLLSSVTHEAAIEVLSKISTPACDAIFGDAQGTRLLLHCVGLLPWMGMVLHASSEANLGAAFVVSSASSSAIQQELAKARAVGMKVAKWCVQRDLQALADAFFSYANGGLLIVDELLEAVARPICQEWFPEHTLLALGHLLAMLEKGPVQYHQIVLLLLQALLRQTTLRSDQAPLLYASVSQLLDSGHGREQALGVLEAILNCCTPPPDRQGPESPRRATQGRGSAGRQSRGGSAAKQGGAGRRALSSDAPFDGHSTPLAPVFPSADAALRNTQLALERVLDSCGSGPGGSGGMGRTRDMKRIVPFVDGPGSHGGSSATPTPRTQTRS